jgi:flagellar hook-associated protein 2
MGVIGAGISINGPSGIDTASLVDQLTALEQQKVTTVQNQASKYQVQIDAYSKLRSTLATVQTAVNALKSDSSFDVFKSDSSDSSIVTLKGDVGAVEGQYDIGVFQLASSEKMISSDNLIASQSASLSSQGITVGDISIDGTKITIDANDTIQDLRSKINSATDAAGNKLNVNASVLKISDTDYRIVLTAKTTGSTGVDYQDVTGGTFKSLGIISGSSGTAAQVVTSQNPFLADYNALAAGSTITFSGADHNGNAVSSTFTKNAGDTAIGDFLTQIGTAFGGTASVNSNGNLIITDNTSGTSSLAVSSLATADASATPLNSYAFSTSTAGTQVGNKGNTAQALQSADNIQTAFDALGAGTAIQYSGIDHNGNAVASTYYKPAAATSINDFLAQVNKTFHGMATATVGTDGKLSLTDSVQGSSQLALTTLSIGGVAHTVATLTAGSNGAGVLSAGKDAYLSLDGLTLKSATNNADGYISGVTIQLHKASPDTTAQTTVTRDIDQIQKNVQAVLDAYNALSKFANDETKMADPNDTTSKDGDLANDMTVTSVVSQVRSQLMQSFGLFGGSYNSLTMIGVKSDPTTGDMSIDQTQFTKALTNNFDEVKHIFVTAGISDNKNITLGRNTKTTQSGAYTLNEPDADHLSIQLPGDSTWYTSDQRVGDIITFSSGPASGLSITSPAGTIGAGNSATFTFSMGLADRLSNLIDNFNDAGSGLVTTHQNSLQDQIKDANSRVTDLQTRVNDYHDGLVKQFAAMEQALNTMKSQEAQMMSALSAYTSSTTA